MSKTMIAAATVAALALPAGALADTPEKPGKSQQAKTAAAAKAAKAAKTQRVGFTLAGTALSGLTVSDAGSSAFSLDVTKANKHARAALALTKAAIASTTATQLPAEANGLKVQFGDGVTDGNGDGKVDLADVRPTDRVKVIGKVARTRTKGAPRAGRFTYGAVDVRKVVVTRTS